MNREEEMKNLEQSLLSKEYVRSDAYQIVVNEVTKKYTSLNEWGGMPVSAGVDVVSLELAIYYKSIASEYCTVAVKTEQGGILSSNYSLYYFSGEKHKYVLAYFKDGRMALFERKGR